MEKTDGESLGGVRRAVPGGVRGIETDTGLPSGVALFRGTGPRVHPGGTAILSPSSSRPSEGIMTLGSRRSPHLGEVAGLGSGRSPGGSNPHCPGTSGPRASIPEPREPQVYNSGSTFLHPYNCEDRPRSILKNSSSITMKKIPSTEKKSQCWDEMNILATYHPANKDYGFLKVDEPKTPYNRLQDSDENLSAGSSLKVTPESLAERSAELSTPTLSLWPTDSSDFDRHRKTHYCEGKFLKAQKNQPWANEEDSSGASARISSNAQDMMMDPKSRTVEKGWAGRLVTGVKNETGLMNDRHVLDTNDSSSSRNQFPSTSNPILLEKMDSQRREYFSKGIYLRSCSHPELQEDIDEQRSHACCKKVQPFLSPDETLQLQWTQEKEPRLWKM
uniref:RIKEN cDNA 2810408A11 gene n=1 Tax=Nannospalax galili TaxID=1026970 RepID=A0A8C6RQQ9_NANGA